MVTLEELAITDVADLPLRKQIESFFKGTDAIASFAKSVMIPILRGQLNLNDKEKAITGTYFRMYAWIVSMVAMNSRIHFQGAAAAARALFELLLDMQMLSSDKTGSLVQKFTAFPAIETYFAAEKLVSFCDEHINLCKIDCTQQRTFITQPMKQSEINALIIKHWGKTKKGFPNRPEHWSGKHVRERARDLGLSYEELYVEEYQLLSWYIHSGAAGHVNVPEKLFEIRFGLAHSLAQKIFLEATTTCAREMKITIAIDWFQDAIADLRLMPGKVLVDEQIKILEANKN